MSNVIRKVRTFQKRTLRHKHPRVLKKLAIAFAIALVAVGTYINILQPHTLEAKQRTQLESAQHLILEQKEQIEKSTAKSKTEAAKNLKRIEALNKQLQETNKKLQAKKDSNTASASVAVTYPMPENAAKAFIYSHESGNQPCKINGGATDCNYNGDRACGLGQSLPCQKLTAVCKLSDYACQDAWFENYMKQRYGTWANAVAFWQANKWW